jgi:anaerobic magnesium-protoporphyrin IX monomethyl ester cyclase
LGAPKRLRPTAPMRTLIVMARVLLILPHLPQRMGCPYLGQQYVASSLLHDGHEVRCLDLAAVYWNGTDDDAVECVERWGPDMVGMTLFTYNARRGYELARRLRNKTRLLVAGGPHPTVSADEPLRHGFDVAVSGEGEHVIRRLAAHLDHGSPALAEIPGVRYAGGCGPAYAALEDLDALPFPLASYGCFEADWYAPGGAMIVPCGLMTSRGCPARCTFCANYVTGRAYRWRSPANVVAEMVALRERHDVRHFPFWDDAFTARRSRLNELCDALLAEPALAGITWTCITPGIMVKPHDLARMRRAGCVAVNFGIESGDAAVLQAIQKGQRPEHVKAAVAAAKAEGMTTIVNFMFGFPGEGVPELMNTLALMHELAPHTDVFNNRGVLVPFPGTQIYDDCHAAYGFTDWWLDPERIRDEPNLHVLDPTVAQELLESDPTLDLDFFHYADDVRETIARCVRFKGRHNQRRLGFGAARTDEAAGGLGETPLELLQSAAASVG